MPKILAVINVVSVWSFLSEWLGNECIDSVYIVDYSLRSMISFAHGIGQVSSMPHNFPSVEYGPEFSVTAIDYSQHVSTTCCTLMDILLLLWFILLQLVELLITFLLWQIAMYFLKTWELHLRKGHSCLELAQIMQTPCSKCLVSSTTLVFTSAFERQPRPASIIYIVLEVTWTTPT